MNDTAIVSIKVVESSYMSYFRSTVAVCRAICSQSVIPDFWSHAHSGVKFCESGFFLDSLANSRWQSCLIT